MRLDIYERIDKYYQVLKLSRSGYSCPEISRELNLPYKLVYGWLHYKKKPWKVSPDFEKQDVLAYLLGVLWGRSFKSYGCLALTTKHKAFALSFLKALGAIKIHGCLSRLQINGKEYYCVTFYSVQFLKWLKSISLSEANELCKNYSVEFLRGFFESHGGIHRRKAQNGKYYPFLLFAKSNFEILRFVRSLLFRLGYHPTEITGHQNHLFYLSRKDEVSKFLNQVKPVINNKIGDDTN